MIADWSMSVVMASRRRSLPAAGLPGVQPRPGCPNSTTDPRRPRGFGPTALYRRFKCRSTSSGSAPAPFGRRDGVPQGGEHVGEHDVARGQIQAAPLFDHSPLCFANVGCPSAADRKHGVFNRQWAAKFVNDRIQHVEANSGPGGFWQWHACFVKSHGVAGPEILHWQRSANCRSLAKRSSSQAAVIGCKAALQALIAALGWATGREMGG